MDKDQAVLFSERFSPGKSISEDPIGALTLFSVPNIGSARFRALLVALGSPEKVFQAGLRALREVPGIDDTIANSILQNADLRVGERLVQKLEEAGARIISIWDSNYPAKLKEIHDPPAFLFVRGKVPEQEKQCIAIVGTRKPSIYGVRQAYRLAEELAYRGVAVVSGMARGIDTAAHGGCLQAKGETYAIFGSGIDVIYPTENRSLAQKIEATGGLISEFLPGTNPDSGLFPRRNRIISGLSSGVLVVQGSRTSGAMITARCAIEQNRDVFALPGNADDQRSQGPHDLIRQGATLVEKVDDILGIFGSQAQSKNAAEYSLSLPSLNQTESELLVKMSEEPVHIDQLVNETGNSVQSILADLLGLEMKGWIEQLPGKFFTLKRRV
ncbi:MAG: DNA-processing protein DprA [bacterium]